MLLGNRMSQHGHRQSQCQRKTVPTGDYHPKAYQTKPVYPPAPESMKIRKLVVVHAVTSIPAPHPAPVVARGVTLGGSAYLGKLIA